MRFLNATEETSPGEARPALRALVLLVAASGIGFAALSGSVDRPVAGAANPPATITVDYPLNGSLFPPDMEPPTFEWRDGAPGAARWQVEVAFADGSPALRLGAKGEGMKIGEIDPLCVAANNKPPTLTPEQAAAHTWKPDPATWAAIRQHAVEQPATLVLTGYATEAQSPALSRGSIEFAISSDPVGAPIFYRDVPLMPSSTEKGIIKPLAPSAVPLIAWRMRNLAEPSSHVVMTGLHSCANCHSFSGDGKTLGLDMDGPRNDKGIYAVVPVARQMTVRTQDMISWASFSGEANPQLRVGFMSQVSPDGRYVLTTIKPPGTKDWQFYYVANFTDYRFLQVFYPTRGILAWYDRETKKLTPLPGADDPRFAQASAVWSPDGKTIVFARAAARDPEPADGKAAAFANDPAEVQIQYDLYRIPFNGGRGGRPEPIPGASENGMSNSFPRISPDGKWMVFVQARNGEIMRPDSKLYIVPAAGGKARPMHCNTPLMNSWHSFSPNGRWMVFSSKSRTPYTQMFLTHIDENGNDSPAILIENSTAANRAVNLPEFVNMDAGGIEHIATPAVDFYKQLDLAADLSEKGDVERAIPEWRKAIEMQADDSQARYGFGQTLLRAGQLDEAIAQLREAIRLKPHYAEAHNNLGAALGRQGRAAESMEEFRRAIDDNPGYPEAHNNLGAALLDEGRRTEAQAEFESALKSNAAFPEALNNLGYALETEGRHDEAIAAYRKAIASDEANAAAHNNLGLALVAKGSQSEAVAEFTRAVALNPANGEAENNLGHALLAGGDFDGAIAHFQRALELGPESADAHTSLGIALGKKKQPAEAIPHFERAIALDPAAVDAQYYLGLALVLTGRGAEGIAHWRQALKADPENLRALNALAWVLATSSDPALRNGAEALPLAEHAVQLTASQDPAILGTLAAACAESGLFDRAVELEQRAAELARQQGKDALAADSSARLELYRGKTPLRQ